MNKVEMRNYLKIKREHVSVTDPSKDICERLLSLCSSYKTIGIYVSLPKEVDTYMLIDKLLKNNKTIVCPKVVGNDIIFYRLYSLDELQDSDVFSLKEPSSNIAFSKDDIEIMIIPGLGFDLEKNRIGYGKGYYDKYLSNFKGVKIGVCFDSCLLEEVPIELGDIKMDIVVTEKRTLY